MALSRRGVVLVLSCRAYPNPPILRVTSQLPIHYTEYTQMSRKTCARWWRSVLLPSAMSALPNCFMGEHTVPSEAIRGSTIPVTEGMADSTVHGHYPDFASHRLGTLQQRPKAAYFSSAAIRVAKSITHDGKIPSTSVPTAGRNSAAPNAGVSSSTAPAPPACGPQLIALLHATPARPCHSG